jgi:F-type H+-transporting ATPase subunit epsilon
MAGTLQLEIVTPDKLVVDAAAGQVQLPGKTGYLGILPKHAPLITELAPGEIRYSVNGVTKRLAVAKGLAEVLPDRVTILAETDERPDGMLPKRARDAQENRRTA